MCGGLTYRTSNYDFPGVLEQNPPMDSDMRKPSFDVRPGMGIPVICNIGDRRALNFHHWGYQANAKAPLAINAKAENLETSSYWRSAYRSRRCVIACDGWYEWVVLHNAPKKPRDRLEAGLTRSGKQRYLIEFQDSPIVFLAGLYGEGAHKQAGKAGKWQRDTSAVVITTPACPQISGIGHHRQPVVMSSAIIDLWLDEQCEHPERLLASQTYENLLTTAVVAAAK